MYVSYFYFFIFHITYSWYPQYLYSSMYHHRRSCLHTRISFNISALYNFLFFFLHFQLNFKSKTKWNAHRHHFKSFNKAKKSLPSSLSSSSSSSFHRTLKCGNRLDILSSNLHCIPQFILFNIVVFTSRNWTWLSTRTCSPNDFSLATKKKSCSSLERFFFPLAWFNLTTMQK